MVKQDQVKLTQWKEFKIKFVEIFSKDRKLCKKRQEDTLSSQLLITKFTQGKCMICSTTMRNLRFKKTKISRSLCVGCQNRLLKVQRQWLILSNLVLQWGKHTLLLQTTHLHDHMQYALFVFMRWLRTLTDMKRGWKAELFYLLISLVQRELKILSIITKKEEQKELKLISPYLL